jgi:ABC-type transport system involved in cytochrome c biogenesis permease component
VIVVSPRHLKLQYQPFDRLVRWELRRLIGQRWRAWTVFWGLAGLAIGIIAWWLAARPEQDEDAAWFVHQVAQVFLIATPLRDPVTSLAQMTFGYAWLRFAVDFLVALTRMELPAHAAASVAADRRNGRLQELQLTGLSSTQIYLAKSLAAALFFLAPELLILILFAGVLVAEGVTVGEVARLFQEWAGQILLTALVTVTCSVLSRRPWMAIVKAYAFLWLIVPALWLPVLVSMNRGSAGLIERFFPALSLHGSDDFTRPFYLLSRPIPVGFALQCAAQALFTTLVCLGALFLGVRRLDPMRAGDDRPGLWRRLGSWRCGLRARRKRIDPLPEEKEGAACTSCW